MSSGSTSRHLNGNREAHGSRPPKATRRRERACANAAWPNDTPPSLAGSRARQMPARGRARASAAARPSASTRFIRQPPPSATCVRPLRRGRGARSSRRARRSACHGTARPPRGRAGSRSSSAASSGAKIEHARRRCATARHGARASRPAPRAPSPPGLRSAARAQTPASAAAASNSRPRLVVSGQRAPAESARRAAPRRARSREAAAPPRRAGRAGEHATPMRHGSRAAAVAARQRERLEPADALAIARRRARSARRPRRSPSVP